MVRRALLSAALASAVPSIAEACHEEPRDSYEEPYNFGLSIGLAFGGTGVELVGGFDVRYGSSHAALARIELRGIRRIRARVLVGGQLVTDGKAVEAGIAWTSATRYASENDNVRSLFGDLDPNEVLPGASLGAFAGAGTWDPNATLMATASIPFLGDLQNWDAGVNGTLILPGKICIAGGRALRCADETILPRGWFVEPDDLDARALARHWAQAARLEAASVPAFVRMARELAAVGAPSGLVAAARAAADDERRHVGLATSLAGAPVGVMALAPDVAAPRWDRPSPAAFATLAREAWYDGCLGEGAAAAEAELAAAGAREDATRAALQTIARDEAGHAALAWDVLAWCRAQGAGGRAAVSEALADAPELETPGAVDADPAWLAAHGVPTWAARQASAERVHARALSRSRSS